MSWLFGKKEWTKKEKIAVLKSLCFIVGADKKIAGSEQLLLAAYFERYHLDVLSAMREQAEMSQDEMTSIISGFSSDDKKTVLNYWHEAICCDGDVDVNEATVFGIMAVECGIDISTR
ncbi:MAG: hypothetical protein IJB46_08580 [Prevotella sp.]|nr:hypothetical protein [Prevotella sp.]